MNGDAIGYESIKQSIDVCFVPQIPGIGRCAGSDVEGALGLIETDLILPLLVIDLSGSIAATVHGDEKGAAILRCLAKCFFQEAHGFAVDGDRALFHFRSAIFGDLLVECGPFFFSQFGGFGFAEALSLVQNTQCCGENESENFHGAVRGGGRR